MAAGSFMPLQAGFTAEQEAFTGAPLPDPTQLLKYTKPESRSHLKGKQEESDKG